MNKELYIVEGLSAASTLQQAINREKHSILALQGKLINVSKASDKKIMQNPICQKIFTTLGCGLSDSCDPDKLNHSNVIILTDPDMDGMHTCLLLLTLFQHYLYPLLESGLVSVIRPPMYRMTSTSQMHQYAWDDKQKQQLLSENESVIAQIKGVAQFNAAECEVLFLNPETRRLLHVRSIDNALHLVPSGSYD